MFVKMRHRNSTDNSEKPILALRRSPRFVQKNQTEPEHPKTPKSVAKKIRVPYSDLTPLSSIQDEGSLKKSQKLKRGQFSDKAKETNVRSKSSMKISIGSRRLTTLSGGAETSHCVRRSPRFSQTGNFVKIDSDKSKQEGLSNVSTTGRRVYLHGKSESVSEKRVTRASIGWSNEGGMMACNGVTKCTSIEDSVPECISDKRNVKVGVNLSEQHMYEKRVTRSSSCRMKDEQNAKFDEVKGSKSKLGANLSREPTNENENTITGVPAADLVGGGDWKGDDEAEKKQVGMKRKKIQVEEEHKILQGWTIGQEAALQRAYFAAKPTPHFWKKVAKMVSGKSAQECFDKVYSELLTPPQRQPRSRAKGMNKCLSLSASKLLKSSEPERKKQRCYKQKNHLIHRTVRQLLQKQYNTDQDNGADLFNVLEPTLDPPTQFVQGNRLFSTPECNREGPGLDKRILERCASAHRTHHLSQLDNSCEATLISPPVLKKIKNKALHEKYIDQLHFREAKRKAALLRSSKSIKVISDAEENNVKKNEAVKDAKHALVFCARDAINQFHHLQSSKVNNFDDTCHDFADSSEDEIEDES